MSDKIFQQFLFLREGYVRTLDDIYRKKYEEKLKELEEFKPSLKTEELKLPDFSNVSTEENFAPEDMKTSLEKYKKLFEILLERSNCPFANIIDKR